MLPVDLERFWADDELAHKGNCFSKEAPQVALGIRMSDECVFAELGEAGNPWGETERERRIALNKRYNDLAEQIVGKRLLREDFPKPEEMLPAYKEIGEVFGGQYLFNGVSTWLKGSCSTPQELEKVLDRVDRMDIKSFILPENWENEKKRIWNDYGKKPTIWRNVRGPVTLATSIYGIENLIFLYYDEPELFERFSQTICKVILEYVTIFREEAGYTEENAPHGFRFMDDDCCLMTPEMYEIFGYPVLKAVFERCSPDEGDMRYQHSDSAMGHLLPILAKLNLDSCNFGPTLTVEEIRKHMPRTRIDGQLAPFTFMRNNPEEIIAEVKRDCEMAKVGDIRGLNLTTAGSINNGSSLMSMRTVMHAIQKYGRY
jgi:uroporphyrinogen decarboxylase